MPLLKIINPDNVDESELSDWQRRVAARAVVFDSEGRVGLLHVVKNNYKLPGGGVEVGEDKEAALVRECEEELGVAVKFIRALGRIEEYRPKWKQHQTSYGFLARTISEKRAPNFTDEEKLKGFAVVWVMPNEALRLLNLKQTPDYVGRSFVAERDSCFLEKALQKTEVSH